MKLEQQVISLEIARRLKELGVKQESLFKWYRPTSGGWAIAYASFKEQVYSAFTVGELGEMLPLNVMLKGVNENGSWFESHKENGQWSVKYEGFPKGKKFPSGYVYGNVDMRHRETSSTEADARGKMLIYLLENNLIKLS